MYQDLKTWLKDSVGWLQNEEMGCCTYKLNDRLAVCIGWSDGYCEGDTDCIHSRTEPTYCITVGVKVWTSDGMRTDYDWINFPYYEDGTVLDYEYRVAPDEDYDWLLSELLRDYSWLRHLALDKDGKIVQEQEVIA